MDVTSHNVLDPVRPPELDLLHVGRAVCLLSSENNPCVPMVDDRDVNSGVRGGRCQQLLGA